LVENRCGSFQESDDCQILSLNVYPLLGGSTKGDLAMNGSTVCPIFRILGRVHPWTGLLVIGLLLATHSCTATDGIENEQQEPVITGTVRTPDGSSLYGILVSAKGENEKYTTSVFTDDQGVYEFPPSPFGSYRVSVGTLWSETVNLTSSGAVQDFIVEMGPGFMNQTTGVSWFNLPGTPTEKKRLTDNCGTCHSLWRLIDQPQTTREGWAALAHKMARITSGGNPLGPDDPYRLDLSEENFGPLMDYLTENFNPEFKEKYVVEAMVRPTGEAARAVFKEWDLSGQVMIPKTTWTDSTGIIWFAADTQDDFGAVGRLDPRTGEVNVWPSTLPDPTFHDVLGDSEENLWITASGANKIVKFDTKTYEYTIWDVPQEFSRWAHTGDLDPDGNFWFTLERGEGDVVRLEPGTGKMTRFPVTTKHSDPYGLVIDREGDVWFTELNGHKVGKIDRETGELTEFDPPTAQAGPRRIQMDSQGKLWLTEFYADKIARLDPAAMEFTEYDTELPGGFPYFILVDRRDQVWFNLLNGNTIGRFDPTTQKFTHFLFPQIETHSRNASLDQSTDPVGIVYERAFLVQRDYKPTIGRMHVRPSD
jgi:virginiamycin B lyase